MEAPINEEDQELQSNSDLDDQRSNDSDLELIPGGQWLNQEVTPEHSEDETSEEAGLAGIPQRPSAPVISTKKTSGKVQKKGGLVPRKLTFGSPQKRTRNDGQQLCKYVSKREKVLLMQNKRIKDSDGTWVKCCNSECNKWRYLRDVKEPFMVPINWLCRINSDENCNTCEKPEVDYSDLDFVCVKYAAGSIVWAKVASYPWWPAMIDDDPDIREFFWTNGHSEVPTHYHVVFLDRTVTRAWVADSCIKAFSARQSNEKQLKKGVKKELDEAIKRAKRAITITIPERLKEFSFANTYTGRWLNSQESSICSDDHPCESPVSMANDEDTRQNVQTNTRASDSSGEESNDENSPPHLSYKGGKPKSRPEQTALKKKKVNLKGHKVQNITSDKHTREIEESIESVIQRTFENHIDITNDTPKENKAAKNPQENKINIDESSEHVKQNDTAVEKVLAEKSQNIDNLKRMKNIEDSIECVIQNDTLTETVLTKKLQDKNRGEMKGKSKVKITNTLESTSKNLKVNKNKDPKPKEASIQSSAPKAKPLFIAKKKKSLFKAPVISSQESVVSKKQNDISESTPKKPGFTSQSEMEEQDDFEHLSQLVPESLTPTSSQGSNPFEKEE